SDVLMGNANLLVERDGRTENIHVPADFLNKVADYSWNEFVTERVLAMSIASINEVSEAATAGLIPGDSIVRVGDAPIRFWDELRGALVEHAGEEVALGLIRSGQDTTLMVHIPEEGVMGFYINRDMSIPHVTVKYGFL